MWNFLTNLCLKHDNSTEMFTTYILRHWCYTWWSFWIQHNETATYPLCFGYWITIFVFKMSINKRKKIINGIYKTGFNNVFLGSLHISQTYRHSLSPQLDIPSIALKNTINFVYMTIIFFLKCWPWTFRLDSLLFLEKILKWWDKFIQVIILNFSVCAIAE